MVFLTIISPSPARHQVCQMSTIILSLIMYLKDRLILNTVARRWTMSKPTIAQLAEMIGPIDAGEPPTERGDLVTIPGYGQIRVDQARTEAVARFRMVADALEAGKNVPFDVVELATEFLRHVPMIAEEPGDINLD